FPKPDEMVNIVAERISGLAKADSLLTDALDLFYRLRHAGRQTNLRKEPSTAELLNWLQILMHRGAAPGQPLKQQRNLVLETLAALVKNTDDRREASEFVASRW